MFYKIGRWSHWLQPRRPNIFSSFESFFLKAFRLPIHSSFYFITRHRWQCRRTIGTEQQLKIWRPYLMLLSLAASIYNLLILLQLFVPYLLQVPCWSSYAEPQRWNIQSAHHFIEIYGLLLAQPISLFSSCFDFFISTQHLSTLYMSMDLVFVFKWVKVLQDEHSIYSKSLRRTYRF